MYSIDCLCPTGQQLGGYGFLIHLSPAFRDAVAVAALTQESVDRGIARLGRGWLHAAGFTRDFYEPRTDLRVRWGAWGPENIAVPGNACGLDLDDYPGCVFKGGKTLVPHNVDGWPQVQLLLMTFTWFAHNVLLLASLNRCPST